MAFKEEYLHQNPAVASYSYTDIAEGTGIQIFYGSCYTDNVTKAYLLSSNAGYSDTLITEGSGSSGEEKILDLDFDLPAFNLPKNLYGTGRAIIPVIAGHETTANKHGTLYAIVKLRKWNGSTETEIASNTKTITTSGLTSLDTAQYVLNAVFNISTVTHFKIGEVLRLTVEIWAKTQGSNGLLVGLFHDPKNRSAIVTAAGSPNYYSGNYDSAEFITSILEFHIPFRIEP